MIHCHLQKQITDIVIIDTAGRLHNKINLMNGLTKIRNDAKVVRILSRGSTVLDGSTGQNAYEQAKQFASQMLAITKRWNG